MKTFQNWDIMCNLSKEKFRKLSENISFIFMSKCQGDILSFLCTAHSRARYIAHDCYGLWYQGEAILGIIENIKTVYNHKFCCGKIEIYLRIEFWMSSWIFYIKLCFNPHQHISEFLKKIYLLKGHNILDIKNVLGSLQFLSEIPPITFVICFMNKVFKKLWMKSSPKLFESESLNRIGFKLQSSFRSWSGFKKIQ